jgi:CarD family transcriptional regulator
MKRFKVKQFVVYPGHGVGQIVSIETKQMLGAKHKFLNVSIKDSGMVIMVPMNGAEKLGLRHVASKQDAIKALQIIQANRPKPNVSDQTWNMRYRDLMERIKTGSLIEMAHVYADLEAWRGLRELSFGERKMLDVAKSLLFRELEAILGEVSL